MFEIRLSCGDNDLDVVTLKCINSKKETGLNSETPFTWVYDQVITKFVLNAMLHRIGMSWIISSNKEMDYYKYTNSNHLDWFNKVPWYNKISVLNDMELNLKILLHRLEHTDTISCVL